MVGTINISNIAELDDLLLLLHGTTDIKFKKQPTENNINIQNDNIIMEKNNKNYYYDLPFEIQKHIISYTPTFYEGKFYKKDCYDLEIIKRTKKNIIVKINFLKFYDIFLDSHYIVNKTFKTKIIYDVYLKREYIYLKLTLYMLAEALNKNKENILSLLLP